MKEYLNLQHAVSMAPSRPTRTGIDARSDFGHNIVIDLQEGFPLLTTKPMPFDSIIAELCGFWNGVTNANDFRRLGTRVWDANANGKGHHDAPNPWLRNLHRQGADDLGPIYGDQWRKWESVKLVVVTKARPVTIRDSARDNCNFNKVVAYQRDGYEVQGQYTDQNGDTVFVLRKYIDQLRELIDGLRNDPHGRRHIVSAWNPGVRNEIALPPCHVFFQCYVDNDGMLDLQMYQRSADIYLGVPFNIASYAALTHAIAYFADLKPGRLLMTFGDVHEYENARAMTAVQQKRDPGRLPTLTITGYPKDDLAKRMLTLVPGNFHLHGYKPDGPMPEKVSMAV